MGASLVYLIGAGPGDPELITLKGIRALEQADVVIYDYLANKAFLQYADPNAELIFVGKKGFTDHVTQPEINDLIVKKALEAHDDEPRVIARLKGGDPFVFGRGGEEALALVAAGIPFEVVPGITSGIAAPAYAGIPVTHRHVASSVAFVTGHEDPTKDETAINWEHLAQGVDTICFYMGVKNLPLISKNLLRFGRPADEPVALVRWGTTPRQETLVSTLAHVAKDVEKAGFKAPAIIVVGKVAHLREELAWFDRKPLRGASVVVTRSRAQASDLVGALGGLGAEVIEFPTIKIEPPLDAAPLYEAAQNVGSYEWLILTSVNGVDAFFDALLEVGLDARALYGVKVAAIGSATAARIMENGVVPDLVPDEYRAEAVLEALLVRGVTVGSRILLARAEQARDVIPLGLAEMGCEVDVVCAYRTVIDPNAPTKEVVKRLEEGTIDAVTFTSSSTVKNFASLIAPELAQGQTLSAALEGTKLLSIGPVTSKTMRELGLEVTAQAHEYTIPGLVEVVKETL